MDRVDKVSPAVQVGRGAVDPAVVPAAVEGQADSGNQDSLAAPVDR
jgi:hypothetical protein